MYALETHIARYKQNGSSEFIWTHTRERKMALRLHVQKYDPEGK